MSIYPTPITDGMKFHPGTEYMICTRKKEDGGGQIMVKQPALEVDPGWAPWQPPEFRDKANTDYLGHSNLSKDEIIGLVAERFGDEAAAMLKPKEDEEVEQVAPSKTWLPKKQNSAMMSKGEIVVVLTGANLDADVSMKKSILMAMYKQLYSE